MAGQGHARRRNSLLAALIRFGDETSIAICDEPQGMPLLADSCHRRT
jgi:hypothetical protein